MLAGIRDVAIKVQKTQMRVFPILLRLWSIGSFGAVEVVIV